MLRIGHAAVDADAGRAHGDGDVTGQGFDAVDQLAAADQFNETGEIQFVAGAEAIWQTIDHRGDQRPIAWTVACKDETVALAG